MDISVVVPVYGCRKALSELHRRLVETLEKITKSYEIILVDDCDTQNSWEEIQNIAKDDKNVVGIHFSRNFGQINGITAGLEHCQGDWAVVMDCDLQDRPESILDLYNKAQEGYDVVFARRLDRQDTGATIFLSKMFYKVYDYFTDGQSNSDICNLSIISRKVVDAYCSMHEHMHDYVMAIRWLGFHETEIDLKEDARFEGKSSYTFKKKVNVAIGIITAQSNKPLIFSIKFGFYIAIAAFVYILYLVIRFFVLGDAPSGWPSIIASVWFLGGLILMSIGIHGIYIGNIFNEVKARPHYIISETVNMQKDSRR